MKFLLGGEGSLAGSVHKCVVADMEREENHREAVFSKHVHSLYLPHVLSRVAFQGGRVDKDNFPL